jgi:hypothetical protein
MVGNGVTQGVANAWSLRSRSARWRGRRRLVSARGGARLAAQARGASGRVPGKVSGGGAHPSGMPAARGRSSGGRLHTSTSDVEVVAGGDSGEVLWLGGGYAVVRAKPTQKRKHGCGEQ